MMSYSEQSTGSPLKNYHPIYEKINEMEEFEEE